MINKSHKKPFLIAEIGINHNGSLIIAKKLIDLASKYNFDAVMHFAGLKAVGESEKNPLNYYENNVGGSLALLHEMDYAKVNYLVFSSSATVYGEPKEPKCDENANLSPKNIYGQTKLMVEDILANLKKNQPKWKIINIRYFNPIGAHPSGLIGEDPIDHPYNLMPLISQVAIGKRDKVFIFGNDFFSDCITE